MRTKKKINQFIIGLIIITTMINSACIDEEDDGNGLIALNRYTYDQIDRILFVEIRASDEIDRINEIYYMSISVEFEIECIGTCFDKLFVIALHIEDLVESEQNIMFKVKLNNDKHKDINVSLQDGKRSYGTNIKEYFIIGRYFSYEWWGYVDERISNINLEITFSFSESKEVSSNGKRKLFGHSMRIDSILGNEIVTLEVDGVIYKQEENFWHDNSYFYVNEEIYVVSHLITDWPNYISEIKKVEGYDIELIYSPSNPKRIFKRSDHYFYEENGTLYVVNVTYSSHAYEVDIQKVVGTNLEQIFHADITKENILKVFTNYSMTDIFTKVYINESLEGKGYFSLKLYFVNMKFLALIQFGVNKDIYEIDENGMKTDKLED